VGKKENLKTIERFFNLGEEEEEKLDPEIVEEPKPKEV